MDSGGATHRQSPFFASFYLPDFWLLAEAAFAQRPVMVAENSLRDS